MTTQIEKIKWHEYPEEKPIEPGAYLCHKTHEGEDYIDIGNWMRTHWQGNSEPVAWADMPKGFNEKV